MPRVSWDRLGRIAMLGVMVAIVFLYLSAGIRLFSAWGESKSDGAQVRVLESKNRALKQQHAELASSGTVQAEARRLGMVRRGEQAYIVNGLPPN
jgi:cell division protein FtsB